MVTCFDLRTDWKLMHLIFCTPFMASCCPKRVSFYPFFFLCHLVTLIAWLTALPLYLFFSTEIFELSTARELPPFSFYPYENLHLLDNLFFCNLVTLKPVFCLQKKFCLIFNCFYFLFHVQLNNFSINPRCTSSSSSSYKLHFFHLF